MYGGSILLTLPSNIPDQSSDDISIPWSAPSHEPQPHPTCTSPNGGTIPSDTEVTITEPSSHHLRNGKDAAAKNAFELPSWTSLSISPAPSESDIDIHSNVLVSTNTNHPARIESPNLTNPKEEQLPLEKTRLKTPPISASNNTKQQHAQASAPSGSQVSSPISLTSSFIPPISRATSDRDGNPASETDGEHGWRNGLDDVHKDLTAQTVNDQMAVLTTHKDILPADKDSAIPTTNEHSASPGPNDIVLTPAQPTRRPPKPKQVFLGVIITRSPTKSTPNRPPHNDTPGNDGALGQSSSLVDALSSAFSRNAHVPMPPLCHHSPSTASAATTSSLPPQAYSYNRNRVGYPSRMTAVRPKRERPLTQAEIDASLGVDIARIGIKVDQTGDTRCEEVLRMNLRILKSRLDVGAGTGEGEDVKMEVVGVNAARIGFGQGLAGMYANGERQEKTVYAIPEKSRAERYLEIMEHVFGPGNTKRGTGPKPKSLLEEQEPKKTKRRASAGESADSSRSVSRARSSSRGQQEVDIRRGIWNWSEEEGNVPVLGKRDREGSDGAEESDRDEAGEGGGRSDKRARTEGGVGSINGVTQGMVVSKETCVEWATALQKLVKGKTKMERQDLRELSNVLKKVEGAKGGVIKTSKLGESVWQLSELGDIPFGDEEGLRGRAAAVVRFWQERGDIERDQA